VDEGVILSERTNVRVDVRVYDGVCVGVGVGVCEGEGVIV
jgi:hypothetical protein